MPDLPEIRLALFGGGAVRERLDALAPDAVHVATEGPLGLPPATGASGTVGRSRPRITRSSPNTCGPDSRFRCRIGYALVRWFHGGASRTLVTTATMQRRLEERGFRNLALWGRGVDTHCFGPRDKAFLDLPRPVFLYFGRLAVEKGVEDFLRLDLPGTKLVVGDGPAAAALPIAIPKPFSPGSDR